MATIPRLDDASVLRFLKKVTAVKTPNTGPRINISGVGDNIAVIPSDDKKEIIELINSLDKSGGSPIVRGEVHFNGLTVFYHRGGKDNKSALFDEVDIQTPGADKNQPILTLADRLAIVKVVDEEARSQLEVGGPPRLPHELAELRGAYQSTILSLETAFAKQIETITNWTVKEADAFKHQQLQLAEDARKDRERQQAMHDERMKQLADEKTGLDQRAKELDDRSNTHARRAIRSDLQQVILDRQKRFSLTPETRRLRGPIHVVMGVFLVAVAVLNFLHFHQASQAVVPDAPLSLIIWAIVKQGALATVLVGGIFYYIRWMNRWFDEHAAAELALKQFQLDVDRASWIVEAAFEWRRNAESELPSALLEGLSRNLFTSRDSIAAKHTAADDLASALLGSASDVKIKVGDSEISLDRKGIAKLARQEGDAFGKPR